MYTQTQSKDFKLQTPNHANEATKPDQDPAKHE